MFVENSIGLSSGSKGSGNTMKNEKWHLQNCTKLKATGNAFRSVVQFSGGYFVRGTVGSPRPKTAGDSNQHCGHTYRSATQGRTWTFADMKQQSVSRECVISVIRCTAPHNVLNHLRGTKETGIVLRNGPQGSWPQLLENDWEGGASNSTRANVSLTQLQGKSRNQQAVRCENNGSSPPVIPCNILASVADTFVFVLSHILSSAKRKSQQRLNDEGNAVVSFFPAEG